MISPSLPTSPLNLGRKIFRSRLLETIVSPNGIDGYGELLDPTFSVRDVKAEVIAVERQTPRSVTLTLAPNPNWTGFTAGQHVGTIVEVDGVLQTRFYSPASDAARDDTVELTISMHDGGVVSGHLIEHARPGMLIGLTPPEGEFVLPEKRPGRLLLIGGGSGITPVISMLRTLVAEGHKGPIDFVQIARSPEELLYKEELDQLAAARRNVTLTRVFTRAKVAGAVHGHLTHAKLRRALGDYEQAHAFVCGPPALIEGAEKIWTARKVRPQLYCESFVLPEIELSEDDIGGPLRFSESNVETVSDGGTLLDQAEAAGLSPKSGCRMGICHTCIAYVPEGVVRDVRTGELKVVKDEFIQTCIHVPVGEFAIDL